jgi:hypothetical protein
MRSGFEKFVKKLLNKHKVKFKYEPFTLPYVVEKNYKPDFVLSNGILIETKGNFPSSDRTKMLKVKEQHPDLDIRLWFQRDNWVTKKHNMRYSEWAEKNGFKYHVGETLPKEWFK